MRSQAKKARNARITARQPVFDALEPRLALAADLGVTIGSISTSGSWLNPYEPVAAAITITNVGTTIVKANIVLNLDAVQAAGLDVTPLGQALTKVSLRPGASTIVKVTGFVPPTFEPGPHQFRGTLTYITSATPQSDQNQANDSALSTQTRDLAYRFGAYKDRKGVVLTVPMGSNATPTTFSLVGEGYGQFVLDEPLGPGERTIDVATITLAKNTANTTLNIATGTGGPVEIGNDILVLGPIGKINAPTVSLLGNDVTVAGSGAAFTFDDLTESTIEVLATTGRVSLAADRLHDSRLESFTTIESIAVNNWSDSFLMSGGNSGSPRSRVSAPGINGISCTFDFDPRVNTPITAVPAGGIGTVTIGSALRGRWSVGGKVEGIRAGTVAATFAANFSGGIGLLASTGDFSGNVAAANIDLLEVGGNLINARVLAGPDLGDDVQVGGTDENADELVSNPTLGHIGAVTIRGNMVGSVIGLAYVPGSASRPAAFIQGQSGACGSIFVGGTVQGSYFAGLAFPPQASINGLLITTASNPLFITSL